MTFLRVDKRGDFFLLFLIGQKLTFFLGMVKKTKHRTKTQLSYLDHENVTCQLNCVMLSGVKHIQGCNSVVLGTLRRLFHANQKRMETNLPKTTR